jgi:DNA-binding CsgD family transcriptional regulator
MRQQVFGRDAELAALSAFLTSRRHSAGALVLPGPAGSGKTTLLRAGAALAAEQGFCVLETTPARSELRLAFAGLSDLLAGRLPDVAAALPPPQARALRVALLEEEPAARPPEPRLIAAAFRSALAALAAVVPVLVVVDDVQWLDQPSESAIGFAVRRLQDEPVGLICAQRTDRPGAELPLELDRGRLAAELLPVGALSIGALHRLLRTRLGTSFSQPALRMIEAQSGGNPFIALELGRALARRGVTGRGSAVLPVPDTLSGLVDERLGDLSPGVLDAVRLVAVMPDAPVSQYVAAGAAGTALDAAVLAGVLDQDGGRLRFSHPLLAAAVAAAIPPARRRELHAIAADLGDRDEDRARHRALAVTGPAAPVAAELEAAARAAVSRGAPTTAAELFELAASLTPPELYADVSRRTCDAARQLTFAGTKRAAIALLEAFIGSAPAGPERADALYQLGWMRQEDSATEATGLLEQALAETGRDPARAAKVHLALGDVWSKRGDQVRATAEAHDALADAEIAGEPALIASTLGYFVLREYLSGGGVDERCLDRAMEIERAIGTSQLAGSYLPSWVAGYCHLTDGFLEAAQAELERVLTGCDAEGLEYWRADVMLRLSLLAVFRGDLQQASAIAAAGLESAEQCDQPQTIAALLYACGEAALQLGELDAAREAARRGMAAAKHAGDSPYFMRNSGLLGSIDLALGNYSVAAARLGSLASEWLEMGARTLTTNGLEPQAVEALSAVGNLQQAQSLLAEMERYARGPLAAAIVARGRGQVAAALGGLGIAVAEFTDALSLHGQVSPQPVVQGRILLELGGVQRRLKQRGAARSALSEALRLFESVGAPLWAARARAELARISGRAPGPTELTVTELRVAELVASGRTNQEAAAELFVTVRAIESTLTKAYAKLGVRSRTELAARLHAALSQTQHPRTGATNPSAANETRPAAS